MTNVMTDKLMALTSCGTREDAAHIARSLVEMRLAACVSIVPNVTSVYRWQGAIEESNEWLLVIKTSSTLFEKLKQELPKIHPYQLPELIAMSIADGSDAYLNWLASELGTSPKVIE